MAKRKETLEIERALRGICNDKRTYGCEEVTIGFVNKGYGHEIVDFMSMDSKGLLRCYEIKVTLSDLKSKAKKSWYGNYNYLIVSDELYKKVNDWTEYVPQNIGLIVAQESFNDSVWMLKCIIKPKKQTLTDDIDIMLKESLVRTMYYKMLKYMDSQSIDKMKELQKNERYWEKQYKEEYKKHMELRNKVAKYERLRSMNRFGHISLNDLIVEEMEKNGLNEEDYF